jgi:FkbM family methyltransferase
MIPTTLTLARSLPDTTTEQGRRAEGNRVRDGRDPARHGRHRLHRDVPVPPPVGGGRDGARDLAARGAPGTPRWTAPSSLRSTNSLIAERLLGLTAVKRLQPLYVLAHSLALRGMNYGCDDPRRNGETRLIDAIGRTARGMHEPMTVFDVGANVGNYAEQVVNRMGANVRLHCLEPSPAAFARLEARFHGQPLVRPVNVGLGRDDVLVDLHEDAPASELASVYHRRHSAASPTRRDQVQLRRLDHFCAERDIPRIGFLKLDVEGSEYDALIGGNEMLSSDRIDIIQFEFGGTAPDARVYFRDFWELLAPRYAVYRLLSRGLWPITTYRETHEVFTYGNFVCCNRKTVSVRSGYAHSDGS